MDAVFVDVDFFDGYSGVFVFVYVLLFVVDWLDGLVVDIGSRGVRHRRQVGDFDALRRVVVEEVDGGAVDDAGVGTEGIEAAEVGKGRGEGGGLGGVGGYVCVEELC